ncbi:MAG: iron-containing alcohol dehydrogenase [Desulfurococcaceae archaeon]
MWDVNFKFKYGDVEVYFGPKSLRDNLSGRLQGCRRVLIITSKSAARTSGALSDVIEMLEKQKSEYVVYGKVTPNPYTSVVDEAVKVAEEVAVDAVIAIGGGSVIDVSKAVSMLIGTGFKASDLVLGRRPCSRGVKLVVVNLTHGTGSEVNRFAVLTIDGTIEKRGFIARYPDASFDDPVYTITLSKEQTLYTSLDAFYHAYESATSKRTNLLVQTLAEEVVGLVTKYLEKALTSPGDLEARTMLMYASMLAGMCIDMAGGSHLVHAMEHGFSGLKPELPHGAGLAILGPLIVYHTHKAVPKASARLLRHLNPEIKPISDDAEKAMETVRKFQEAHGFNKRLGDYGIVESDLEQVLNFIEQTIVERFSANIPFPVTRQLIGEVVKKAL